MNDTMREYLSYGKFLLPLLKAKKAVRPEKKRWGNKQQYFLCFPAPVKQQNTLVIYYHGGGWNSNSPRLHSFIGQKLAAEGFDCIMAGYRKAPRWRYDAIVDDVFTGYKHILDYLHENQLHYNKIVVMGSSAGAHLGALLCFDSALQKKFETDRLPPHAFLSLAGPLCFRYPQTHALNSLIKGLFGTKDIALWERGEPYARLTEYHSTRLFVIHSPHDGLVGFEQAKAFYDKALSLGIDAQLHTVNDPWNTHSAYCAGIFLQDKTESATLTTVLDILSSV